MKNKTIFVIAALVAIMLISCPQEPGEPGTGNTHDSDGSGIDNPNAAAYVCTVTTTGAYYVNATKRGNLDIPAGTQIDSYRSGCTVSGGKVYVWGSYYGGGSEKYAYWVDGVRTDLSVPTGYYINGLIAVSGGKVYLRGEYSYRSQDGSVDIRKACYWVDGIRTDLDIPDGYVSDYHPTFAISNSKVYAAGRYSSYRNEDYSQIEENRKACYWINGVRTDLNVPAGIEFSEARSITVSGDKVYVLGSYGNFVDLGDGSYNYFRYIGKTCYWIDGVRTDLDIPAETESSEANAITVSGGKVYVSGSYGNYGGFSITYMGKACYWVDGVKTDLSVPAGTELSSAYNPIVSGGKVYMLGEIYDDGYDYLGHNYKYCYWVDGTRTDLVVPDEAEIAFRAYYLTVSGGKVYVYGDSCRDERTTEQYYKGAWYWVDGGRTDIDVPGYVGGFDNTYFAVIGGKLYIACGLGTMDQGWPADNPMQRERAFYWINGVKQELPDVENIRAISLVVE